MATKKTKAKKKSIKKLIFAFAALAVIICLVIWAFWQPPIEVYARGAVVMDANSGRILFEKNMHTQITPSSMTKMMALAVVFENIELGNLSLDEEVIISTRAVSTIASRAGLRAGESLTVETLIICALLPSGSDAVIALGEHLFGSEEAFVEEMNRKAESLSLENTNFQNSVGLEHYDNFSSAFDMAVLSQYLITNYPQILNYAALTTWTLVHEDGSETFMRNTNDMLNIEGVTGLKTGSGPESGFNLALTYSHNGRDLIIVVISSPVVQLRRLDILTLLERFG